jgi:hypothetical protein
MICKFSTRKVGPISIISVVATFVTAHLTPVDSAIFSTAHCRTQCVLCRLTERDIGHLWLPCPLCRIGEDKQFCLQVKHLLSLPFVVATSFCSLWHMSPGELSAMAQSHLKVLLKQKSACCSLGKGFFLRFQVLIFWVEFGPHLLMAA